MRPYLGINTASCGKKLLRISEQFFRVDKLTNLCKVSYQWSAYTEANVIGLFSMFLAIFIHC